ncbi:MAG TPA: MarR family transcriptional regulator [Terriglobales bacterium]|nr:MarR family transcriptional regulator [Terriglobales bacterium]
MASKDNISAQDYRATAEFRYQIRRFLRASEQIARSFGMNPQQYQLMLALKGLPEDRVATVGEIAERLQIQHHSTVELADRLAAKGLIRRKRDSEDRRQVLLELTAKGDKTIKELAIHHREELRSNGPELVSALKNVLSSIKRARR